MAQQDRDRLSRVGGWLFRHRTSIPLPIVAALLLIPTPAESASRLRLLVGAGMVVVGAGELLRLWAVHHIGVISRTRSERVGGLIDTGPFSVVRNPLYLGNIMLWLGFALGTGVLWLVPVIVALLASEYHAIVRWEEQLLEAKLGDSYRDYLTRVPRWMPRPSGLRRGSNATVFTWRETFYSERGTLIAIAVGSLLLWLKSQILQ